MREKEEGNAAAVSINCDSPRLPIGPDFFLPNRAIEEARRKTFEKSNCRGKMREREEKERKKKKRKKWIGHEETVTNTWVASGVT